MLVIFTVAEMMMKMMAKTQSMKIKACKAPLCENSLQILDMTPSKSRC